jgi:Fe-S cluster assembly protein SufD
MILPTQDQMNRLAAHCDWQEPNHHDEQWKYDPRISLPWDMLPVQKKKILLKREVNGISIYDLQEYKNSLSSHNPIEQLANALYENGMVIQVPSGCVVSLSLKDLCFAKTIQKIVIIVEPEAIVTCIDDRAITESALFCESLEMKVGQAAQVKYIDQITISSSIPALRSLHVSADANSFVTIQSIQAGTLYHKLFARAELCGAHAQVNMRFGLHSNGSYYHSIITEQVHIAPYTQSNCTVKAAQHDAQTMYHGYIMITKEGKQSQAFQQHKALLLNAKARAYARPTLEVLTNDVQCGHGSAIGMIDQEQLWYLQSRGLSKKYAQQMLVNSFLSA